MDEKYTNALKLNVGFYDVTTVFFKETAMEIQGENHMSQEEVVMIRMSPQLAKAYHKLLGENLQKYEKDFGTIPDMPTQLNIPPQNNEILE